MKIDMIWTEVSQERVQSKVKGLGICISDIETIEWF